MKKKTYGNEILCLAIGFIVGLTLTLSVQAIYTIATMPEKGTCYAHNEIDTYAKVLSVEEGLVQYQYASRSGWAGEIKIKERTIESFKNLYTEQQDCSGYMYNKWIIEKEQAEAKKNE